MMIVEMEGEIDYLDRPDRWRGYDPVLFDYLANGLKGGGPRSLSVVEGSDLIPGFDRGDTYP